MQIIKNQKLNIVGGFGCPNIADCVIGAGANHQIKKNC